MSISSGLIVSYVNYTHAYHVFLSYETYFISIFRMTNYIFIFNDSRKLEIPDFYFFVHRFVQWDSTEKTNNLVISLLCKIETTKQFNFALISAYLKLRGIISGNIKFRGTNFSHNALCVASYAVSRKFPSY